MKRHFWEAMFGTFDDVEINQHAGLENKKTKTQTRERNKVIKYKLNYEQTIN